MHTSTQQNARRTRRRYRYLIGPVHLNIWYALTFG